MVKIKIFSGKNDARLEEKINSWVEEEGAMIVGHDSTMHDSSCTLTILIRYMKREDDITVSERLERPAEQSIH